MVNVVLVSVNKGQNVCALNLTPAPIFIYRSLCRASHLSILQLRYLLFRQVLFQQCQ